MFIDEIRIYARAGHGGKGCVAFQREKYRPKGGPSGGNGGRGGDVILLADHDLNNLIAQYYQPSLMSKDGKAGMGKGMDGHAGKELVVKVPCGTMVWRLAAETASQSDSISPSPLSQPGLAANSSHRAVLRTTASARAVELDLSSVPPESAGRSDLESKRDLVADLTQHGQRLILCKGGRGGLGNRNFATAAHQAPRFAQPGEPGEEGYFFLELRIIAEVGLIGYPNAGKSTLLTAISHARPKIAPYPFTTLHPQIGIVEYADFRRLTVCDVPGLIEGAHRNVGLGHEFLRHVERCKVLVLLLDMAGADGRMPWDDYKNLLRELELYDPGLLERPRLVVANKMDEPVAEANLKTFKRKIRKTPLLPIAAAFDQGIEQFRTAIREAVEESVVEKIGHKPAT
jgi:GTP-binding protein